MTVEGMGRQVAGDDWHSCRVESGRGRSLPGMIHTGDPAFGVGRNGHGCDCLENPNGSLG